MSWPQAEDRFRSKYRVDAETGCWIWQPAENNGRYGIFWFDGTNVLAHRWSMTHLGGVEIPSGLQIDHLCKRISCVNPAHMEIVTPRINERRSNNVSSTNSKKTHCTGGHPLSGVNLYRAPSGDRHCRTCRKNWDARNRQKRSDYYQRKRLEAGGGQA